MEDNQALRMTSINWRWLIVTYCFLVMFHLFPSSLVSGMSFFSVAHYGYDAVAWPILTWVAVGIVVVCAYVGYRSAGITLGEAGIASTLYVATLFFVLSKEWPSSFYNRILITPWLAPFLILVFLTGLGGAAFGKWLQLRKQKRQQASQTL